MPPNFQNNNSLCEIKHTRMMFVFVFRILKKSVNMLTVCISSVLFFSNYLASPGHLMMIMTWMQRAEPPLRECLKRKSILSYNFTLVCQHTVYNASALYVLYHIRKRGLCSCGLHTKVSCFCAKWVISKNGNKQFWLEGVDIWKHSENNKENRIY